MAPDYTSAEALDRLENGEVLQYAPCVFSLPAEDDRQFLFHQRVQPSFHKNIAWNPRTHALSGHVLHSAPQADRLGAILKEFSERATAWLAGLLPRYASAWRLDRVSFRPEEEALRKLRPSARNDLLHIDAFPTRPSQGDRILRLFVNLHPSEARVWITGDRFAALLERYGAHVGLPATASTWPVRFLKLFRSKRRRSTPYDQFMLNLHHFLKANEDFQERSPKRFWHFPPGSAWLFFADDLSYAELRGQFALEHSYFVPVSSLLRPHEAPVALLEKACGRVLVPRAA